MRSFLRALLDPLITIINTLPHTHPRLRVIRLPANYCGERRRRHDFQLRLFRPGLSRSRVPAQGAAEIYCLSELVLEAKDVDMKYKLQGRERADRRWRFRRFGRPMMIVMILILVMQELYVTNERVCLYCGANVSFGHLYHPVESLAETRGREGTNYGMLCPAFVLERMRNFDKEECLKIRLNGINEAGSRPPGMRAFKKAHFQKTRSCCIPLLVRSTRLR